MFYEQNFPLYSQQLVSNAIFCCHLLKNYVTINYLWENLSSVPLYTNSCHLNAILVNLNEEDKKRKFTLVIYNNGNRTVFC